MRDDEFRLSPPPVVRILAEPRFLGSKILLLRICQLRVFLKQKKNLLENEFASSGLLPGDEPSPSPSRGETVLDSLSYIAYLQAF